MKEKYKELHGIIVIRGGLNQQMKILDNKFSKVLLELMVNENVDFQLVPEHIYRQNAVERAIRTWKIISRMESVELMTDFQCICEIDY